MTTTITEPIAAALPPIDTWPARVRGLPRDARGFPVPWFVAWFRGGQVVRPPGLPGATPDFRIVDTPKLAQAISERLCWLCGQRLGKFMAFVIGPMCAVTRITSEPPCHRECAAFAATTCPFLVNPRMRRNEKDKPAEKWKSPAGNMIARNPGVACVWTTVTYTPFRTSFGVKGQLINVGQPSNVEFYARGRSATRAEVVASIESGLPLLQDEALQRGPEAQRQLEADVAALWPLLPSN